MSDAFEEQEWVKFGVAAALARQYAADQRAFLERLAQMLEKALPGEAEVKRAGGLFTKKTVQKIAITFGEDRYTLEDPGRGPLRATLTHIVRGIALKTEETTVEAWLEALGSALEARARTNATARDALARMVE